MGRFISPLGKWPQERYGLVKTDLAIKAKIPVEIKQTKAKTKPKNEREKEKKEKFTGLFPGSLI